MTLVNCIVRKNNGENKRIVISSENSNTVGKFRYRRKIPISSENSDISDVNLSENSDIVGKLKY